MKKNKALFTAAMILLAGACGSKAMAKIEGDRLVPSSPTKEQQKPPHPRMTSEFYNLVQNLKSGDAKLRRDLEDSRHEERATPIFVTRGEDAEEIEAYIWLENWHPKVRAAVEAAGAEIEYEDSDRHLLQAWIPLDRLEDVAAVSGVRHLRRPSYGIPTAGSSMTQGDSAMGSNLIRISRINGGIINGAGIKIGVMSSGLFGFQNFTTRVIEEEGSNNDSRVRLGDLPPFNNSSDAPSPTSRYLGAVEIFPFSFSLHAVPYSQVLEGALMLETVHDIAPGAELFFADGRTDVQLQAGRNFFENRGVDVVVDNMTFIDSGRFDGTSAISRRAQSMVLNKDIAYVVSVGNQEDRGSSEDFAIAQSKRSPLYINGHFSPDPSPGREKYHNFAAEYDPSRRDEYLVIHSLNGVVDVSLTWDDVWDETNPRAMDDLDMYLYYVNNGAISALAASSVDMQQNSGRPFERITKFQSGQFALAIKRKDGSNASSRLFTLVISQGAVSPANTKYLTHGIPLNNADALPPVISVGAIDIGDSINQVASMTIPGLEPGLGRRTSNSYFKWFSSQAAPSVVGYSNTYALTHPRFTGSSAGAAHIAGLVALLRHTDRSVPSYLFYDLLRDKSAARFPNATELHAEELSQFGNPPRYLRVNGYDTWFNMRTTLSQASLLNHVRVSTVGELSAWESSSEVEPFAQPVFGTSDLGLSLSPGGEYGVFGFWQTDLFELPIDAETTTTRLGADRVYEVRARVGSDESDPTRVPNFRLRLITGGNDEAVTLEIAGVNADAANTPTTIGGQEYVLYYRPSNQAVADQGVRFAFDLVHVDERDNPNATLYLQEVSFREFSPAN